MIQAAEIVQCSLWSTTDAAEPAELLGRGHGRSVPGQSRHRLVVVRAECSGRYTDHPAAEEISATDLSRRIALDGPATNCGTWPTPSTTCSARLETAFVAQRQLVDDASHELRNPLAVIQANVDAVLARTTSPDERPHATTVVGRATARMSRLVDDLLATARRNAPAFTETDVDLADVAAEASEEFRLLAADRHLTCGGRRRLGTVVSGDRDALRRARPTCSRTRSSWRRSGPRCSSWPAGWTAGAGWPSGTRARASSRPRAIGSSTGSGRGQRADGGRRSGQRRPASASPSSGRSPRSHGGTVALHSELGVGSTFVLWAPRTLPHQHHPPNPHPTNRRPPRPPPVTLPDPARADPATRQPPRTRRPPPHANPARLGRGRGDFVHRCRIAHGRVRGHGAQSRRQSGSRSGRGRRSRADSRGRRGACGRGW